jgi:hypothetical protein
VSFFDDEPDEPTRVTRPARPRRAAPGGAAAHRPDPEIARRRQFVLFGGLAVIAIILIFTAKSCSNTRHKNALKDYNRDVASIVEDSDQHVSKPLFDVLSKGGATQDVRVQASQLRLLAEDDAKRARALDAPDDAAAAQNDFELVMNLRETGVTKIGDLLPKALSNQPSAGEAIRQVAGQMQSFLASDVVYSQRVAPLVQEALDDNDIGGQTIATSKFLPSIGWLDANQVGDRLNPDVAATSNTGPLAPGTHGHGLISVKTGTNVLAPGVTVNHVPSKAPLPLDVTYANQGENDEANVTITAKITGGPKTISGTKRLNQTKAGSTASVTMELKSVPPPSSSAKLTVTIKPVRGEQKIDNNSQTYTILFQ